MVQGVEAKLGTILHNSKRTLKKNKINYHFRKQTTK